MLDQLNFDRRLIKYRLLHNIEFTNKVTGIPPSSVLEGAEIWHISIINIELSLSVQWDPCRL